MGFFSRLKEVKETAERGQAALESDSIGSLGSAAIPGETPIELPAGRIQVIYEGNHRVHTDGQRDLTRWPKIAVELAGEGERPAFVENDKMYGTKDVSLGTLSTRHRVLFGEVEISDPGTYTVKTEALDDFYLKPGTDPKLLFDPAG